MIPMEVKISKIGTNGGTNRELSDNEKHAMQYIVAYNKSMVNGAMFDARLLQHPKGRSLLNLIYWRQLDATRNPSRWWGKHISHTNSWRGRNATTFRTCLWSNLTSTGIIILPHASVAQSVSTRMGSGYLILKCQS